ncbi:Nicotinate phosphoribosyltransferase [Candidatus Omnitrophus magneticus]|uniref:Glutamine-dependent NAD(+) synthetase n=1 Tax=Candidatus Omnitrophus magneticus TaxID=1609969 RepID=A0A0F0CRQ3_9BACT|nr:Nicotinate phosphoribosyltransferase [Candidatus Omnitrophus magneticus]
MLLNLFFVKIKIGGNMKKFYNCVFFGVKKGLNIFIAGMFFISNLSYALSPSPGSNIPSTKTAMAAMTEERFITQHGSCPIDFTDDNNLFEDICVTIPQLKKAYTAFNEKKINKKSYDLFLPAAPHDGGYIVASGLEIALADIRERKFSTRYIEKIKQLNIFSEEFLNYLSNFVFKGDIDAVTEGTVISSGIPIMRIVANEIEIALLEGLIKNRINLATNIATKTSRIIQAANGEFADDKNFKRPRSVADFGLRRAQGKAADLASRSAIIGGASVTSNVKAASLYGLKSSGTMAHLFITSFSPEKEIDAFRTYAKAFPDSSIFLIDTYDTLEGARRAAIVAKEMEKENHKLAGVRLDSGDLVDLSKKVREILDNAGLFYVKIFASDDLDEYKITDLISRGAMIDAFGVGTNLITGGSQSSLKLELQPSFGENVFKITGKDGKVSRYIETPKNIRTLNVTLDEQIEELLVPYWRNGERVALENKVEEARDRTIKNLKALPDNVKLLKNAETIPLQEQVVINPETDALIIVDAQPTFMPGGGLPVTDGDKIMPQVSQLMNLFPKKNRFATRDLHPKGHISLASSYKEVESTPILTYDIVKSWTVNDNHLSPNAKFTLDELKDYLKTVGFQILWPDHGVEGTEESKLHSSIPDSDFEYVLIKGADPKTDSYSGFFDNRKNPTGLAKEIHDREFKRVFVVGLAMDYCVGWTAEGAREEGFQAIVIDDATKPVCFPEGNEVKMYNSFIEKEISLVSKSNSLVLANENTQTIKSIDTAKKFPHPIFTDKEERTALTEDMYHLTMGQALFKAGLHEKSAVFDYFYRTAPYERKNIIVSGLKNFIEELRYFKFTKENIEYLRGLGIFSEDYLKYLKNFEFHGNIDAMEEGSLAFPREPIIRVSGTMFETMIIETFILNIMNFNSLEATWADETRKKSPDKKLIEDGLSDAQGRSHKEATRSAYIGGIDGTTNLEAHTRFDVPLSLDEETELLSGDFITGGPKSSLGGVYKLALYDGKERIKLSDNPLKTSLPGLKKVFAILDEKGIAIKRVIASEDEDIISNDGEQIISLLKPIVQKGKIVYKIPSMEITRNHKENETSIYQNISQTELSEDLTKLQKELVARARQINNIDQKMHKPNTHIIARTYAPSEYGTRFNVPADKTAWEIEYPGYEPRDIVLNSVLNNDYSKNSGNKWADPADYSILLKDIEEGRREPLESFEGPIKVDKETNLPLNPIGRTGIKNRGQLGKYGPNRAADPIVTRINPDTGEYEILIIVRNDSGINALPGGMVERIKKENKVMLDTTLDTAVRELQEETNVFLDEIDISKAVSVYKGYVDDRRNTDNAWMETEAWHFHIEDSAKAMSMTPKASSDARKAMWVPIDKIKMSEQNPTHELMIERAKQRLEQKYSIGRDKLRVAMAQINAVVGDMRENKEKILDYIERAKKEDADVVIFPELTITGYAPEDLVYKGSFIKDNLRTLYSLAGEVWGITAIVGFIDIDSDGNRYNSAAIISDGKIKGIYKKHALPNYSIFDEKRYFTSGDNEEIYDIGGIPFGVHICEDLWVGDNTREESIYLKQAAKGAKILFNLSASPYYMNKLQVREDLLKKRVKQTGAFIVYTNLVGGQDEALYDGGSFITSPDGTIIAQAKRLEEDLVITDLDLTKTGSYDINKIKTTHIKRHNVTKPKKQIQPALEIKQPNEIEVMYKSLVLGTRDYIKKNGFKKVVIGISGGIDSALVAAIAVSAIGKENVLGISMPSRYNSTETQSDAKKLAETLGIEFKEIPIESVFSGYLDTLQKDPQFSALGMDTTEENLQARTRGNLLMAYSNKFGYLVLTTSNKSESAVGYATLYGDMAGGFAPINDVYKTKVFELSRYVNSHGKEIIPWDIITRPPSAELKEDQKDEDSLPPYDVLDQILQAYLERNESIAEMSLKWDSATVEKVVKMIDRNEYKRRQAPPGIKITPRNLGKDWRLPITNKYKDNSFGQIDTSISDIPEIKLTDNEKTSILETVNLFHSQRIEILLPQSMELTEPIKDSIERIKKINGNNNFSCKPYTERNLKIYLETKEKGVKRIIVTTNEFSQYIKNILNENPLLFQDERILNINLPAKYFDENEKTQYQARTIITAILARLFEKDASQSVEMFLKYMLLNAWNGNQEEVKKFMNNLGVTEQTASNEQIAKRVLYFLDKVVRCSEILEKEQRMMEKFLTYA